MGNCKSQPTAKQSGRSKTTKLVHIDGRLQGFRQPTTAAEILSGHPNCFLCSSDTMNIGEVPPQVSKDHVLQIDQIYFLMPLSKSLSPLSLQDLCALAIKASTSIAAGD